MCNIILKSLVIAYLLLLALTTASHSCRHPDDLEQLET